MGQAEEIKSKLDIVEVLREYIPVKAVGANFQALCPFHNEKTPSLVISPDKQIWHCFGCGRGGDVFSFVMEKEGLSFIEALRLLAPKAGVTLKFDKNEDYSQRNRLLDILKLAGKYYSHFLENPIGKKSLEYLFKRGLSSEIIKDWQLGYSPGPREGSWDTLYKFLKQRPINGKKYSDQEIFLAGLSIEKKVQSGGVNNRMGGYYDRFRNRIMFPIWDINNNIIAFTARISPEEKNNEKVGKYINSPQTQVYDKSRVLFALNKAKESIRKEDLAIVVEGQMDAIACHQHGFKNVVASSGTALSSDQVKLLKRFTSNIALLFDMDAAGQIATDRGIKEVLAQELNLKIIVLDGYKDPDECLQNNPDDFQKAIDNAQAMLAYYFSKVSAGLDLDILENKRQVRDQMFSMIALVVNKTEQGYWLKKISEELGFFEIDIREEFLKWQNKNSVIKSRLVANNSEKEIDPVLFKTNREEKLSEFFLALLIKFPEFINYATSNLNPAEVINSKYEEFYKVFIVYYNKTTDFDYQNFRKYLQEFQAGSEKSLDKLILLGEKNFYDYKSEQVKLEIINIISDLKKYSKQKKIQKIQEDISRAEKNGEKELLEKLMNDLKNIMSS